MAAIPYLGAGLGYRRVLHEALLADPGVVDFVEILVDQFLNDEAELEELEKVCDSFRGIPHGIGLSIGSAAGVDKSYLRAIRRASDITKAPYYSEHLALTRVPGIDIGHLSPIWFSEPLLEIVRRNVDEVQSHLGKPLVLENITYVHEIPGSTMSQGEFFSRLVDGTGCGVLLDLTNLHINSTNHGLSVEAFLDEMPLGSVVQVHLAGGFWRDDILIDGHSEPVDAASWALLQKLVERIDVRACVVEHDANFPENERELLDQIGRARSLIRRTGTSA